MKDEQPATSFNVAFAALVICGWVLAVGIVLEYKINRHIDGRLQPCQQTQTK